MVKLAVMPSQDVISGYKGAVDFYVYMGIPCARKWPRSPGHNRTPAVAAQWPAFTVAARGWQSVSATVRRQYEIISAGTGLSPRDMFTRSYISGLFRNPIP